MSIRVQREDFDLGAEYALMTKALPSCGAIVAFVGRVRDFTDNRANVGETLALTSLTLEHYEGMTQKELIALETRAFEKWSLLDCLIVHRFGELTPGDQIVLVLTAAKHRHEAFESAQFLMDWLKTKAPFWKKEETNAGENWVSENSADIIAAQKWNES